MNNASGSYLRKVSFALALIIAAALGYLSVRYRLRVDQERADMAAATATPESAAPVATESASPPTKPNYLPLRARLETNIVRVGTNRSSFTRAIDSFSEGATATDTLVTTVVARDGRSSGLGGALVGNSRSIQSKALVSGRVVLRGAPPPEMVVTPDTLCGGLRSTPLTTRHYVVGSDGGLGNTFIYIKSDVPSAPRPRALAPPVLDQVGCEYQPYMMGVQTGQTFTVRNSDPIMHNVHVVPKIPGNREKNVAQPVLGMMSPFSFPKSEVWVQFKCDVHPWMYAYIGVVDHPWFAVTDKDGNFSLPAGLPVGQYTLAAKHLKLGEMLQQINVSETGVEPLTFTFEIPTDMAKSNTP